MATPMQSATLQASLNRIFQGYNLSEMGENDDKLIRAELFDDYLIISDIIKEVSTKTVTD
jgi:hypothetical protein